MAAGQSSRWQLSMGKDSCSYTSPLILSYTSLTSFPHGNVFPSSPRCSGPVFHPVARCAVLRMRVFPISLFFSHNQVQNPILLGSSASSPAPPNYIITLASPQKPPLPHLHSIRSSIFNHKSSRLVTIFFTSAHSCSCAAPNPFYRPGLVRASTLESRESICSSHNQYGFCTLRDAC
jgi:hypothetical protein